MPFPHLDPTRLNLAPLAQRRNLLRIEDEAADPLHPPKATPQEQEQIHAVAERVRAARAADKPVIMAYGAHAIKNGLGPVMIRLAEGGWVTHFATNGAGGIHDWEFAYQGESSEDVRDNVPEGRFGTWEETGRYTNLAVAVGAYRGMGYGEALGAMIHEESLQVPDADSLRREAAQAVDANAPSEAAAAAVDLWRLITRFELATGRVSVPHPWKRYSVPAAAYRLGLPFTVHPGIGYDIIHTHPFCCGGAIGRAALCDFMIYADSVSKLTGGAYLSVGSAIMSPMIFEKSMSMAQNLARQRGEAIEGHFIAVNDIQEGDWDWGACEPPKDNPAYYLRFCKSFSRMGGEMAYVCADNRVFLGHLFAELDRQRG